MNQTTDRRLVQINFTGSSSTGKTTILKRMTPVMDELGEDYIIGTEVVRNLIKECDVPINEQGTVCTQSMIFNAYRKFLDSHRDKHYVSDRCLIDPVAYTAAAIDLLREKDGPEYDSMVELYGRQMGELLDVCKEGLLSHAFYFPIEFATVADGVRSTDESYRSLVDDKIRVILKILSLNTPFTYTVVSGTVEERMEIVKSVINGSTLKDNNEEKNK